MSIPDVDCQNTPCIMSFVHHTKLQINGPSGHCSHLDFHPPPEVQQPSPMINDQFSISILLYLVCSKYFAAQHFLRKEKPVFVTIRFIITTGYLRMFSAPAHKSLSFITRKPKNCFWKAESCCIILLYTFHNSAIYSSC